MIIVLGVMVVIAVVIFAVMFGRYGSGNRKGGTANVPTEETKKDRASGLD